MAIRIEGTDGWVGNKGWRGPLEASSQDLLRQKFPAETNKIWPLPPYEHRNFLDCFKSRKPTTYTAETGHRLSTVMHIGNIAMDLGRKLQVGPAKRVVPRRRRRQRPAKPAVARRLEEGVSLRPAWAVRRSSYLRSAKQE